MRIMSPAAPIKTAMVLAAGLGARMRPLTETLPKPLVRVHGRTLLDRMIDRLAEAGVERVVVNTHHLAGQVEDHVKGRASPVIAISREPELLETGGGVKKALDLLGGEPFMVANSDALILNGPFPSLPVMTRVWDAEKMDALLLLHDTVRAIGYDGRGDFMAEADGRLSRRPELELAPWIFAGVQILKPALFKDTPDGSFSLNMIYDKALEHGRLYGTVHDGEWFHVGAEDGLRKAEDFMSHRYAGREYRST